MGHRVRLVILSQDVDRISNILDSIVGRWGGCTVTDGTGLWNPGGKGHLTVCDKVTVCDTSVGVWDTRVREWWYNLAATVAELFDQECVYLSIQEERATFVGPDGMIRHII